MSAQALTVPLFYISPLFIRKFNDITLALGDVTGFTFKQVAASRAAFCFMQCHDLPVEADTPADKERYGIVTPDIKEFIVGNILQVGKELNMIAVFIFCIGIQQKITDE